MGIPQSPPAPFLDRQPARASLKEPNRWVIISMPTVLRSDGFVFRVYGPPREHPPPHVHVERGAGELAVIRLGMPGRPPDVWAVYGMKSQDVVRAFRLVERHHTLIEAAWRRIHG